MRDYNFRFVGLMHRQLGGGVGGYASNFLALATYAAQNFVAPSSGFYLFVAWGSGGLGGVGGLAQHGGGSGAYLEVTRFLAAGQTAVVRVGRVTQAEATTVTFPDASVASAGQGQPNVNGGAAGAGGVATGGDFMLNGSAGQLNGAAGLPGAGTGGGAGSAAVGGFPPMNGAPARLPFRGGAGISDGPSTPGATGVSPNPGGDGLVLVVKVS
jgi:hypothetical protein